MSLKSTPEDSNVSPFLGLVELPLSDDRMAILRPKLQAIMDDFQQLEELESGELEPMIVLRRWKSHEHEH